MYLLLFQRRSKSFVPGRRRKQVHDSPPSKPVNSAGLQVTPPCTTTAEEAREGLAGIDKALEVADRYCES